MTERRPHWTDELIEAVSTTIVQPDGQVGYWDTEATCDVIAVVEDWMIGKDTKLAPAGTTPEAAIVQPETCGDAWEDEDSFGYCHECRLPKGHSGDHVCANQDDDQDACHWRNWDDDTPNAG